MSIKVLIKRKIISDKYAELAELLKQMRTSCTQQPGYISGETLNRLDKPGENLVISTWKTLEDWQNWQKSPSRIDIQENIDFLLQEKTEFEIYQA
ncbi:MAG: antibiotic biosynthesis monooxygenase [Deltaproteobacteria bacterium]|nr:antibiotic biosynthesis monooxygenase [Deltaproteobacteria bacterium]